jgi:hypothetical protein
VKTSKRVSWILLAMAIVTVIFAPPRLSAQTATAKSSSGNGASGAAQWSVQVDKVNSGDVDIEPAFRAAIYENLVDELGKTKQFQQVYRDSDRTTSAVPNLLILKTTVQKYTAGSETRRAVTTVSGCALAGVRSFWNARSTATSVFGGATCEQPTTSPAMWPRQSNNQLCRSPRPRFRRRVRSDS